jgi:DNA helicase HerA-like ATPase
VGTDDRGELVCVPRTALNTHVAVVGAAGSGKTWTAKIIAEEAVRNGVPVLAIDPQGDLVQFLRRSPQREIEPRFARAYEQFWERAEPRIYTPGSSHATRLSLNPLRLPKVGELAHIEDPARRAEEEALLIQAVSANLVALANVGGDVPSQETFMYRLLLALPRDAPICLATVVQAARDPAGHGLERPDALIKKGERERLAVRLNGYVLGPAASLFEGGQPLDLEGFLRANREGRIPINVIYLSALANDDQKQFFVASLAAEIYRWMVTRASATDGRTNLLFYVDEARDYIPAGTKQTPAKQPLIRLFTQGRKYGVGCLLCTQSPRSVDYNVFGNCSTKIIGRLESAQDVDRVREWFSTDGTPEWLGARTAAPRGTFVARWAAGARPDGDLFRGRQLFSMHEGAWSPDRLERELTTAE